MKFFISSENVPLGYVTPRFPSPSWPVGNWAGGSSQHFLYYPTDIWRFTVFWAMITFTTVYTLVGLVSAFNMVLRQQRRRKLSPETERLLPFSPLLVAASYTLMGIAQGFIGGAIVGLVLSSIYKAGSLTMSTGVPLCWGFAMILYHICSSYSTSSLLI